MAISEAPGLLTEPASDKGDSKDFLEHLRTVHFALLATCLALVVIVLGSSSERLKNAMQELDVVSDTATAFKNANWVFFEGTEFSSRSCGPLADPYAIPAVTMRWTIDAPDPTQKLNKLLWLQPESHLITLADFKDIWDGELRIICPVEWASEPYAKLPVEKLPPEDSHLRDKLMQNSDLPPEFRIRSTGYTYLRRPAGTASFSMYDVTKFSTLSQQMRNLIQRKLPGRNLPHRDFKDAFYDLDQATTGIQQDATFTLARKILQLQENSSTPVFEAFGQKFPADSATRWGVLIIVAIQFYFWLHFLEYKRRRFNLSATAWIGTYPWWPARFLFVLTAIIVPAAVVMFVCHKVGLLPKEMAIRNWFLCSLAVIISIILGALSLRVYLESDGAKS